MPKVRIAFVLVFALIGGVLSANYMPLLLDRLFVLAQQPGTLQDASQPVEDANPGPDQRVLDKTRDLAGQVVGALASTPEDQPPAEAVQAFRDAVDTIAKRAEGTGTALQGTSLAIARDATKALRSLADEAITEVESAVPAPTGNIAQVLADRLSTKAGRPTPPRPTTPATEEPVILERYPHSNNPGVLAALAMLGIIIGAFIGTRVSRLVERSLDTWEHMETGEKVTLFLGCIAGVIASLPFLFVFQGLGGAAGPLTTVAVTLGSSALAIYALRSMSEVLPWHKSKAAKRKTGIKILDTNVIIDGRIHDLARTGFLEGTIYVPGFVLRELQHIADSQDGLRRQRGRRGLDVLRLMQADFPVEVGTHDRLIAADSHDEVDARLVKLAKALGGDLVSNDFNLNRVASLQEVRVLNVNDLALSLRPNVLPGETMPVTIIREGNQFDQGVAYLEDGTMVVVEHGKPHIGKTAEVMVTQVIQTERGKMIFATADFQAEEEVHEPGHGNSNGGQRRRRLR